MKYLNKKIVAIAVVAAPIVLLGALWLRTIRSLEKIDITQDWDGCDECE